MVVIKTICEVCVRGQQGQCPFSDKDKLSIQNKSYCLDAWQADPSTGEPILGSLFVDNRQQRQIRFEVRRFGRISYQ